MKKRNLSFIIILIFIYMFSVVCAIITINADTKINITTPQELSDGWAINNDLINKFPYKITTVAEQKILLTNTLPYDIDNNYVMLYPSNYSIQNVYIEDKLVYTYGSEKQLPFGNITGNIKCLIPLCKTDAGKSITIEMIPYYENTFEIQAFQYGPYDSIVNSILMKELWRIPLILILLLIGIVTFLLNFYRSTEGIQFNKQLILYYSVFNLSIASWLFCSSNLPQFITNKNGVIAFSSFINLLVVCYSYSGFCRNIFKNNKMFKILQSTGLALIILNIVLYALNIKDPIDLLFLTHIYITILLVSNIVLSIKEIETNKNAAPSLISTLLFAVLMIISLMCFYKHPGSGKDGVVVAFGFGFLTLALLYIIISNEIDMVKEFTRMQVYKRMAYEDQLTGLNNRASLEEDMNALKENTQVTFIMCDLNYLKQTNDTLGHEKGDILIQSASSCIRKTFENIGKCYRLGGDEFAIILLNNKINANTLLATLQKNINESNKSTDIKVSLAYGYSTKKFKSNIEDFKREIYKEADDEMYNMKIEQHGYNKSR